MSDHISVSPLLDDMTIGVPMVSHYGVTCFPAIKNGSEQRYIVKRISIPQSQTQLDALLITGAYSDPAQAAEYFRELSEEIADEVTFLKDPSLSDGFLPYESCQAVPMERNRLGYEIYLLGSYKLSLEKYMRRHNVTHLEAFNLAIDMCDALLACRKAGMLYIDLKPSNIFVSSKKEYKIGDLGFVPLTNLKFTSMPAKYRSVYTAPELQDDLNVLNLTADTFALGMILYQIFNNGALPSDLHQLSAPAKADPSIGQIILKACAYAPEDRWQDPADMKAALIAYMQTNSVNNTMVMSAIAPNERTGVLPSVSAQPPETPAEDPSAEDADTASPDVSDTSSPEVSDTPSDAENPPVSAEVQAEETEPASQEDGVQPITQEIQDAVLPDSAAEIPETEEAAPEILTAPETSEISLPPAAEPDDVSAADLPAADTDESVPVFPAQEDTESSADAEPVIQDVSVSPPEPDPLDAILSESVSSDLDSELAQVHELLKAPVSSMPTLQKPRIAPAPAPRSKHRGHGVLITILVLLLLLTLAAAAYVFHEFYYIQKIDSIDVTGTQNQMIVQVNSNIDNALLSVVCSDPYGVSVTKELQNGQAVFTDLNPGSLYKINVEISGTHKLVGQTSEIFTTEMMTNILSFTGITGAEDGSVLLNFHTEGHEPEEWRVIYTAPDEPELGLSFSGHSATVINLTVGKEYTFRLEATDGSPLTGEDTLAFTASKVVLARELNVAAVESDSLTVTWSAPANTPVDSWTVRCYGDNYDETQTTAETQAVFTGINEKAAYNIEVTATGMTQPARTSITANPITITGFDIDESASDIIAISWEYTGPEPEGGWLLMYSVDGNATPIVLKCPTPFAAVTPRIPGCDYHFTVQAADNASIFGGTYSHSIPGAGMFKGHGITAYKVTTLMLPTPDNAGWNYFNTPSRAFTTEFTANQSISLVVRITTGFFLDDENVEILYVIRDENGNAIPELALLQTRNWAHMWEAQDYHVCSLGDLKAPSASGKYTLELYFDGGLASSTVFTVS